MIAFKQPLEDLMAGGPYYFCASIFTSAGTAHGEVMVFALALVLLAWVSRRRVV